jgi:hypothetical protein
MFGTMLLWTMLAAGTPASQGFHLVSDEETVERCFGTYFLEEAHSRLNEHITDNDLRVRWFKQSYAGLQRLQPYVRVLDKQVGEEIWPKRAAHYSREGQGAQRDDLLEHSDSPSQVQETMVLVAADASACDRSLDRWGAPAFRGTYPDVERLRHGPLPRGVHITP